MEKAQHFVFILVIFYLVEFQIQSYSAESIGSFFKNLISIFFCNFAYVCRLYVLHYYNQKLRQMKEQ